MAGRPYVLREVTWQTIKTGGYDVAVLPWGATEAHNYHLPYGTDVYEAESIATEAARIAFEAGSKVIVLPTVPFGVNTGQLDIPLTINMNPSTQLAVLADVVASLEAQGIPKLVVLNGHGGNDFKPIIRELQPHHEVVLATLNWWTIVDGGDYFEEPGDHGGELETSVMQHLQQPLVAPLESAGAGDVRPFTVTAFREGWAWTPRAWTQATKDTGVGNPAHATPEKGARYFAAVTAKIASFLIELARTRNDQLYQQ